MPILVVGADHPIGRAIVEKLVNPEREVRAFVSDTSIGAELKGLGAKVAVGDLSDESHVAAAATNCFSIAFVAPAIDDSRELALLAVPEVPVAWARAARDAGITRVIWVGDRIPAFEVPEVVEVDAKALVPREIASEVARLDDLQKL